MYVRYLVVWDRLYHPANHLFDNCSFGVFFAPMWTSLDFHIATLFLFQCQLCFHIVKCSVPHVYWLNCNGALNTVEIFVNLFASSVVLRVWSKMSAFTEKEQFSTIHMSWTIKPSSKSVSDRLI